MSARSFSCAASCRGAGVIPTRNPVHVSAKWLARRLGRSQSIGNEPRPQLVVGLGNPGVQYLRNRHNVGFLALDSFAATHHLSFSRRRFNALLADGMIRDDRVLLAKPQTYMNDSGRAVGKLVSFHRVAIHDIIIVYDDLDLPLGRMRMRASGGAGGHHGMESIIAALGRDDMPRLRIGIGRPSSMEDIDHVLGNFSGEERKVLDEVLAQAVEALNVWIDQGIVFAMNRFNA